MSESTMPVEANLPANEMPPAQREAAGCGNTVGLWGAGFMLPCISPTFYRRAVQRPVIGAIGFLMLFGMILTILQTIGVVWGMIQVGGAIGHAFDTGEFPEITISGGVAEIDGPEPCVLLDEDRMLVVFDTTGTYTEIDRARYDQGILLTRTELIYRGTGGQYEEVLLDDLNTALEMDPITINKETVMAFWDTFSVIFLLMVFLVIALWHIVLRLAYLAMIALILWGITALIRPGTGFGPVLTTGVYAVIPAFYARFLLTQVGLRFPGLFTFFLLVTWGVALALTLMQRPTADRELTPFETYYFSERPLRGWRALIGLPLLIDLVLEITFHWDAWAVTWLLALVTLAALAVIGVWPLVRTDVVEAV